MTQTLQHPKQADWLGVIQVALCVQKFVAQRRGHVSYLPCQSNSSDACQHPLHREQQQVGSVTSVVATFEHLEDEKAGPEPSQLQHAHPWRRHRQWLCSSE